MSKNTNPRSRVFTLMLYPEEDKTHENALKIIKNNYKYCFILHDKDIYDENVYDDDNNLIHGEGELKKPHYHVIVKFNNPRYLKGFCKTLGIQENYCQKVGDYHEMLTYIIHLDYPEKHQYSLNEVQGPLKFDLSKILKTYGKDEDEKIKQIFEIIDNYSGYLHMSTLNNWILKCGLWSTYRRMGNFILRHLDEHNVMCGYHEKMGNVFDRVNYQKDMEEFFDEH